MRGFKADQMIYWNDDIDKKTLKEFGFDKNNCFVAEVYNNKMMKVTLNISYDGEVLRFDILNESFLQPYDYQCVLRANPNSSTANEVKKNVDGWMYKAQDMNIIKGFDSDNYLYSNYTKNKCYN